MYILKNLKKYFAETKAYDRWIFAEEGLRTEKWALTNEQQSWAGTGPA